MAEETSSTQPQADLLLRKIHQSLHELVAAAELARTRAAREQKLHPTDMACLGYLRRMGAPVSPKQITTHLNLTAGSGTALLDRLESAGYTTRLPNPEDRRSVLIALDRDKAKEPLERLAQIEQSYAAMSKSFSEQDLRAIAIFLEEMNKIARELAR